MITLHKYIFYKAYFFCINIFKEKEFPYVWASFIVAFLVFMNLVTLQSAIEYYMLPEHILTYSEYNKYSALNFLLIVEIFFWWKGRYNRIVEECSNIKPKTVLILKFISIFYILISIFLSFYFDSLIREYNLNE